MRPALRAVANWFRMRRKLRELALLSSDWDSYGSVPPTADAIESAQFVLDQLFRNHHISPVSGGGIQFDFCIGNNDVEISIDPEGSVDVWSDSCGR